MPQATHPLIAPLQLCLRALRDQARRRWLLGVAVVHGCVASVLVVASVVGGGAVIEALVPLLEHFLRGAGWIVTELSLRMAFAWIAFGVAGEVTQIACARWIARVADDTSPGRTPALRREAATWLLAWPFVVVTTLGALAVWSFAAPVVAWMSAVVITLRARRPARWLSFGVWMCLPLLQLTIFPLARSDDR